MKQSTKKDLWKQKNCLKSVLKQKGGLLKKYPQAVVRDNATRKEKIYTREDHRDDNAGENG